MRYNQNVSAGYLDIPLSLESSPTIIPVEVYGNVLLSSYLYIPTGSANDIDIRLVNNNRIIYPLRNWIKLFPGIPVYQDYEKQLEGEPFNFQIQVVNRGVPVTLGYTIVFGVLDEKDIELKIYNELEIIKRLLINRK